MNEEIYISTDIEANGPIPGDYSMLSLGSVAIDNKGNVLDKFYKKLAPLPGAKEHPQSMEFWSKNPDAFEEATSNSRSPKEVMESYADWLSNLSEKYGKKMYFLAYPATWDFMFVAWYLVKFVKRYEKNHFLDIPFHHQGIDIRTFSMAQQKLPYSKSGTSKMPSRWLEGFNSDEYMGHKAVDDAEKQGKLFIKILKENRE